MAVRHRGPSERLAAEPAPPEPLPYRIDWWLPMRMSPGEWGGRWDLARDAAEAREIALAVIGEGAALGQVCLTVLAPEGVAVARVVVDAQGLADWGLVLGSLPGSACDQTALPPLGRECLVLSILSRCRDALNEGRAQGLIEEVVVSAIVEVIDQAFTGVGPAIEVAALRRERIDPGALA